MSGNEKEGNQAGDVELKRFELETQRFEFEKQAETQKQELQRLQIGQARWDAFWRFFGSAVITSGIAAAIAVYGHKVETETTERARQANAAAETRASARERLESKEAEKNRRSEILIQLISAREAADSSLRARMFEALLANYFTEKDNTSRITIVEMIGLNFRDAVQVKPIFELLERDLRKTQDDLTPLRNAAKTIIADQLKEIKHARAGDVCSYELVEGEVIRPSCFFQEKLVVKLTEFLKDESGVKVRINSKDGKLLHEADIDNGDEFSVTYYDMPMTDYTIVGDDNNSSRYSIVLEGIEIEAKKAKMAIAVLPTDSYSTQQEYKFDEAIAEFIQEAPSEIE